MARAMADVPLKESNNFKQGRKGQKVPVRPPAQAGSLRPSRGGGINEPLRAPKGG